MYTLSATPLIPNPSSHLTSFCEFLSPSNTIIELQAHLFKSKHHLVLSCNLSQPSSSDFISSNLSEKILNCVKFNLFRYLDLHISNSSREETLNEIEIQWKSNHESNQNYQDHELILEMTIRVNGYTFQHLENNIILHQRAQFIEKLLQSYSLHHEKTNHDSSHHSVMISFNTIHGEHESMDDWLKKNVDHIHYILITHFRESLSGLHFAMASLIQCIQLDREATKIDHDTPTLPWRGFMLDCCRHFFSIETIQDLIDILYIYKFNVFHWHLTEDQAWRIEISAFPKLTEIGAWRKYRLDEQQVGNDDQFYGGFYSKSDILKIVDYCHLKGILIVPEIELPGHSSAAVISYPELACQVADKNTLTDMTPPNEWGIFGDVYCAGNENTFKFLETVLEEVMQLFSHSPIIHIGGDEVPLSSTWTRCSKCKELLCNRNNQEEEKQSHQLDLPEMTTKQLYSYFIDRIFTFLKSKGKCMTGWDEVIMDSTNKATVMMKDNSSSLMIQSWRGTEGAQRAIRKNIHTILSPTSHCYFDYGIELIPLKKVLLFDPLKMCGDQNTSLQQQQQLILGGECNCWTERMQTKEKLQQMILPRLLAMSESLWFGKDEMTHSMHEYYCEFLDRCQQHYCTILNKFNIGKECYPLECELDEKNGNIHLTKVDENDEKQEIYFSIPGCTNGYVKFEEDLSPTTLFSHTPREVQLCTKVIRNSLTYGMEQEFHVVFHRALFCQVKATLELNNGTKLDYNSYQHCINTNNSKQRYSGGILGLRTLVNGMKGNPFLLDSKHWIGFEGICMVEIICNQWKDPHGIEFDSLKGISVGCLHKPRSWIFMPEKICFYYQTENNECCTEEWNLLGEISCWDPQPRLCIIQGDQFGGNFSHENVMSSLYNEENTYRLDVSLSEFSNIISERRMNHLRGNSYIRSIKVIVYAYNHGTTPSWHHSQGGKPSWLFLDQITVW
ncbi:hypothetical protein C9374_007938 [Naegleria lovaniensis]|uniref:beta-N-acetylhexosaminidase n=1 Tax=Naegleria lovaniensis TaxID=51637 RepID=A0AA88KGN7_NAELO|nr:uncharacterized protein C9374_007938 [Naegleria lovaniensis]KAG2378790.1 hypothetical protein C9374_007938 [Naegleria lovaniensis]